MWTLLSAKRKALRPSKHYPRVKVAHGDAHAAGVPIDRTVRDLSEVLNGIPSEGAHVQSN